MAFQVPSPSSHSSHPLDNPASKHSRVFRVLSETSIPSFNSKFLSFLNFTRAKRTSGHPHPSPSTRCLGEGINPFDLFKLISTLGNEFLVLLWRQQGTVLMLEAAEQSLLSKSQRNRSPWTPTKITPTPAHSQEPVLTINYTMFFCYYACTAQLSC
jgi:hypothetical protein